MQSTQEQREKVARQIEQELTKAAGAIRNRIIEGMDYFDAIKDESVKFWTDSATRQWEKLRDQEVNLNDGNVPDFKATMNT